MKTIAATAALTIMFLSAGAFAGSTHHPVTLVGMQSSNITVIEKNQTWPVWTETTVKPCELTRCIDI